MGVSGLWSLYEEAALPPTNDIVALLHDKQWRLGVDVPVMVRARWACRQPNGAADVADVVDAIVQQYFSLTQNGVRSIMYVFDNNVQYNPLKLDERERRTAARKRQQDNHGARQAVLDLIESNSSAEIPDELKRVGVVNKLLSEHTTVVVSETEPPRLHTDLAAVAQAIRLKHRIVDLGDNNTNDTYEPPAKRTAVVVDNEDDKPPPELYTRLMKAFDDHGIHYEISADEAEHLLAAKTQRGELDVIVTNDSDALLFGGTRVLRNFCPYALAERKPRANQIVELQSVLARCELTRAELVDVAIMAGCDFTQSRGLPRFGVKTALKAMRALPAGTRNIENILATPAGRVARAKLAEQNLVFDFMAARAMFMSNAAAIFDSTSPNNNNQENNTQEVTLVSASCPATCPFAGQP